MKLFVVAFQLHVRDMSINLCGRNVSMAEHLLDRADVGAVLDEVRGE